MRRWDASWHDPGGDARPGARRVCLRPGAVRGRRDGIGALANVAKMQSICVARNAGGPLPLPAGGCQLIEESSTMGGAYGAPCRRLLKPLHEEVVRCAMLTVCSNHIPPANRNPWIRGDARHRPSRRRCLWHGRECQARRIEIGIRQEAYKGPHLILGRDRSRGLSCADTPEEKPQNGCGTPSQGEAGSQGLRRLRPHPPSYCLPSRALWHAACAGCSGIRCDRQTPLLLLKSAGEKPLLLRKASVNAPGLWYPTALPMLATRRSVSLSSRAASSIRSRVTYAEGESPVAVLNSLFSLVCPIYSSDASRAQERSPLRLSAI